MSHAELGPGKEFDAIRELVTRWGPRATGIGDDAALIDVPPAERVVVSTDTSVEHVHFRRGWLTPEEIGWRATMAALSDLAAMGARPLAVLTALAVPPGWRSDLPAIGDGIGAAASAVGAHVAGGDLSAAGDLSLGITVVGSVNGPLMRTGAHVGDAVWVTGKLGGPAAALRSLLDGGQIDDQNRLRFARPFARIEEGMWLAAHGATSAIDISDGLIADARHVAAASHVVLAVDLDRVPTLAASTAADAAASGEEYELLVTAPETLDARAFAAMFQLPLTRIGDVRALRESRGVRDAAGVVVTAGGARVEFTAGHDHFSA